MCDPNVDKLIFTDSQTSITNLVTAGKKNKYDKLSKFVLQLAQERLGNIYISKVKAHSGDPGNDEADKLAKMGTMSDVLYVLPDEFDTIDAWFEYHKYLRLSNQFT
jgi:ribonuclease HI